MWKCGKFLQKPKLGDKSRRTLRFLRVLCLSCCNATLNSPYFQVCLAAAAGARQCCGAAQVTLATAVLSRCRRPAAANRCRAAPFCLRRETSAADALRVGARPDHARHVVGQRIGLSRTDAGHHRQGCAGRAPMPCSTASHCAGFMLSKGADTLGMAQSVMVAKAALRPT